MKLVQKYYPEFSIHSEFHATGEVVKMRYGLGHLSPQEGLDHLEKFSDSGGTEESNSQGLEFERKFNHTVLTRWVEDK